MIPCKDACSRYAVGCHKNCARWRVLRKRLREDDLRKKRYLRQHDDVARAVIRQCSAIASHKGGFMK